MRLLLVLALGGCSFAESDEDWRAGLEPAGPCFEANLLDGLDTASTSEAHAVFACLNATGALDAYAGLDTALDGSTREGAVGLVLARWLATLPEAGLSLAALVDAGLDVVADPTALIDALAVGFELVYATPWPRLGATTALNSTASLDAGLLVPMLPVAGLVATTLIDEDLASLGPLAEAVRSPTAHAGVWTLASVAQSDDPTLAALADDWALDVSDALGRVTDASNDRWDEASGNSLADLAGALLAYESDGRLTIDHVAVAAEPILADAALRDALADVLAEQSDAGRLAALPSQLVYLASVDARGGTLSGSEDSALVSLVRLLHDGNREVECSVDLYVLELDISLGNLSVALLELLADQDPGTVDTGVGLLGDVLGVSLTDDLLETVAESGVCPAIDAQLVEDLHAVDRLGDAQTDELLFVLLDALAAIDARGQVEPLVDVAGAAWDRGLVRPVEELLRDTADSALVADAVGALPALLDPWAHHDPAYFPADVQPLDFAGVWNAIAVVLQTDADGRSALSEAVAPVRTAIAQDATWTALGRLGALLAEPDARSAGLLDALDTLCTNDPDLETLDGAADRLEDAALVRPLLIVAEAEAPREAIAYTELTREGPIPFTARLVQGGTLQLLLDTLRSLSTLLPEDSE